MTGVHAAPVSAPWGACVSHRIWRSRRQVALRPVLRPQVAEGLPEDQLRWQSAENTPCGLRLFDHRGDIAPGLLFEKGVRQNPVQLDAVPRHPDIGRRASFQSKFRAKVRQTNRAMTAARFVGGSKSWSLAARRPQNQPQTACRPSAHRIGPAESASSTNFRNKGPLSWRSNMAAHRFAAKRYCGSDRSLSSAPRRRFSEASSTRTPRPAPLSPRTAAESCWSAFAGIPRTGVPAAIAG